MNMYRWRWLWLFAVSGVLGGWMLLWSPGVWAHTSRVNSFTITPTTNVSPGQNISFSASVYGWHCGHGYNGEARIYAGRTVTGTALFSRSGLSFPNVCGSSSTSGRTYSLSGTIRAGTTPGTNYFILRICAVNFSDACTDQTVSYTIVQPNRPPTITNPGNKTVAEGQSLAFTVSATDPDTGHAAALTWTATGVPSGATFSGSGTTGSFSWTPNFTQAGTYSVTFTVRDPGSLTASTSITITVTDVNRPPSITSNPPTSAVEDQLYSYDPRVSDPDTGDTHTWQLTTNPTGVSFTPSNGQIRWTPGDAHADKSFTFVLRVCDKANACVDQTWTVAVRNVNDPPQITGTPGTSATEDQLYTFAPGVSDPDPGDTHTWTLKTGPTGATIDKNTGRLAWTPGDADAGKTVTFTIEVCDKQGSCVTKTWTVAVTNVNDPPVITSTPPSVAIEKQTLSYKPTVQDPDPGESHTWTLEQGPTGATINASTGEVRWTPGTTDAGKTYTFRIKVCDKQNACTTQTWTVTVSNVNDPPQIVGTPPTTATEDQLYTYKFNATDPDPGDTHTWTLKKGPTGAKVDPQTGQVTWTPGDADAEKTVDFEVEVCDKANACVSLAWKVTVKNVNDPPTMAGTPSTTATEKKEYSFAPTVQDPDPNDSHVWTLEQGPTGAKVDPATGKVTWTPGTADADKTVDFEVKVCDKAGACVNKSWQVKVENVNDPPKIGSTPPTTATEDQAYGYSPSATDPDANDALTWSIKKAPPGATIDKATGKISWTPGDADADQTVDFEIEVCDAQGACDKQTWQVKVTNVNDPPVISGTPPTTAYVGEAMTYEPKVTDPDPNDSHTWTVKQGPTGATIDPQTGKVSWTPDKTDAGKTVEFVIEVCDKGTPPACVEQKFSVKVEQRCKIDTDCSDPDICVSGLCIKPGCANQSPKCAQGQFCKDSQCAPDKCLAATCAAGTFCRPPDGQCVQPCAGLTCPTGEFCKDGACVKDPCVANPCASDQLCDVTTDPNKPTCVKNPCGANTCRHGRVCAEGKCIDDPCATIQCPSKQERCLAGQCVDREPCQVDVDCPDTQVCLTGKCYPAGCYTQSNTCTGSELCLQAECKVDPCIRVTCQKTEFCRRNDGVCASPCANVNCKTGEICVDGKCQVNACAQAQCSAGEVCILGECKKERCNVSNACKHGRVCDAETNLCQDDPCAGVKCPDARQICRSGQCISPPTCVFDKDCPGQQLCVGGKCINPTCDGTSGCQANEFCLQGACVSDPCAAVSCNNGEICRGGQCKPSCAGVFCKPTETCVDGQCAADPCLGKQCATGERCVNGNCVKDPCEGDSCKQGRVCLVDKCDTDPCLTLKCPGGQSCKQGQCVGDLPCKSDKDCPGDNVCLGGKCVPPGCYVQTCAQGNLCIKGECKPNSCGATNCRSDEICRPVDGKCIKLCRCQTGQRCNAAGECEADPCDGKTCKEGERCESGQCVPDDCAKQGANLCKHQRHCVNNQCTDDPCKQLTCPAGMTCREGVCLGPPFGPEPGPEPVEDASSTIEQVTDMPEDANKEGSVSQESVEEKMPLVLGGGCGCMYQPRVGWSFGLLLLLFAGLFGLRRRATGLGSSGNV